MLLYIGVQVAGYLQRDQIHAEYHFCVSPSLGDRMSVHEFRVIDTIRAFRFKLLCCTVNY